MHSNRSRASPEPKVEVFRGSGSKVPLVLTDPEMAARTIAVVTDEADLSLPQPVFQFDRQDFLASFVDYLEETMKGSGSDPAREAE